MEEVKMAKKEPAAETLETGEVLETDDGLTEDERKAQNPRNPEGWHPDRQRARDGVKASDLSRTAQQPSYEPKHSSEAYLGVTFGTPPDDLPNEVGNTVSATLDAVKESWKQVDEARGPILNNTMETEHARLDRLDQYSEKRKKQAEQVLEEAENRIAEAIEKTHEDTRKTLTPTASEAPMVSMWQAALSNKTADELRTIVAGAIDNGDSTTLKATLGAPEWMVPMGTARTEMMHRYESLAPVVGKHTVAKYRERLHEEKERIGRARKAVKEHFDSVLSPQQKADLRKARERQQKAQDIT